MQFFSGFSLQNDAHFFREFMQESDLCVCGFSYGAIKAFEYTQQLLKEGKRVDTLQLFSPAFFQSKDVKFKRLQTMSFKRSADAYIEQFIASCFLPYDVGDVTLAQGSLEELNELLHYEWDKNALKELASTDVVIEVYLGGEDRIIDVNAAREFFLEVATVTYIKEANHFLQLS